MPSGHGRPATPPTVMAQQACAVPDAHAPAQVRVQGTGMHRDWRSGGTGRWARCTFNLKLASCQWTNQSSACGLGGVRILLSGSKLKAALGLPAQSRWAPGPCQGRPGPLVSRDGGTCRRHLLRPASRSELPAAWVSAVATQVGRARASGVRLGVVLVTLAP